MPCFLHLIKLHKLNHYVLPQGSDMVIIVNFSSTESFVSVDDFSQTEFHERIKKHKVYRIAFSFVFYGVFNVFDILHTFNSDCFQIGFDGKNVFSTFANIQALNTGSFISYTIFPQCCPNVYRKVFQYIKKGFKLLVPLNFCLEKRVTCELLWKRLGFDSVRELEIATRTAVREIGDDTVYRVMRIGNMDFMQVLNKFQNVLCDLSKKLCMKDNFIN